MKNKTLIILSIVGFLAFLLVAYKLTATPQVSIYPEVNVIKSSDHVKWAEDKKNILVEYSDLQCPACKSFHEIIKTQLEATAPGKVDVTKSITFVYRHYPLLRIHPNSQVAALAAEAAGKQGKFFEYADLLFTKQEEWAPNSDPNKLFLQYAESLKLNKETFAKDMSSDEVRKKVAEDVASGDKGQINATPTFFLNGEKLNNLRSFDEFVTLLQEKAKK